MNYSFTLEVAGIDTGRENYEDALYKAGGDDPLIAVVNGSMSWISTETDRRSKKPSDVHRVMSNSPGQGSQGPTDAGIARSTDIRRRFQKIPAS